MRSSFPDIIRSIWSLILTLWYPRYDGGHLRDIIQKLLKETMLSESLTNVIIPSFDIKLLQPTVFCTSKVILLDSVVKYRKIIHQEQADVAMLLNNRGNLCKSFTHNFIKKNQPITRFVENTLLIGNFMILFCSLYEVIGLICLSLCVQNDFILIFIF